MRTLIIALVVSSYLAPAVAYAEDPAPVQDIPAGEDKIEALTQGKAAPFSGQLFSSETSLRWANWLMQYKVRLKQDVELEQKICKAQLEYKNKLLAIETVRGEEISKDQRQRVLRLEQLNAKLNDDINDPSFFRSMEFGVILGVVGSVAVAVAVGVTANSLN